MQLAQTCCQHVNCCVKKTLKKKKKEEKKKKGRRIQSHQNDLCFKRIRVQDLCESRGGRPGLPVPNSAYGLCGRKATLNMNFCRICIEFDSGKISGRARSSAVAVTHP